MAVRRTFFERQLQPEVLFCWYECTRLVRRTFFGEILNCFPFINALQ